MKNCVFWVQEPHGVTTQKTQFLTKYSLPTITCADFVVLSGYSEAF
jgi:hypothetical protein